MDGLPVDGNFYDEHCCGDRKFITVLLNVFDLYLDLSQMEIFVKGASFRTHSDLIHINFSVSLGDAMSVGLWITACTCLQNFHLGTIDTSIELHLALLL